MVLRPAGCLPLLVVLVQGCSFSQKPAPIREAGTAKPSVPTPARAAAPPSRSVAAPDRYVVRPGDTLFKIAFELGLDYRLVAQWNGLDNPSLIRAGESLRLTPPPAPRTEPARSPPPRAEQASPVPSGDPGEEPEGPPAAWVWPARGPLLARFDEAAGMKGVDIGGQRGAPVLAAASGRVVYAGSGLRGYGKLIIIKHDNRLLSAYGHNDRLRVSEGQYVRMGQAIGAMGDTDSERVKLHFEIREYGRPVNPMIYLPAVPG